jgi:hypothetical protein
MTIFPPINPAILRCPHCRAKDMSKKGMRRTRHEARQRWGCTRCGHTFTHLVTKHAPYPVKVIMEAICRCHLGYSARDTVRYLTRRSTLRARSAAANDAMHGSRRPVPALRVSVGRESTSARRLGWLLPLLLSRRAYGDHAIEPDIHDQIAVMVHVVDDIGQDRRPTRLLLATAPWDHLHSFVVCHARPDFGTVVIAVFERLQNVVATCERIDGAHLHGCGLAGGLRPRVQQHMLARLDFPSAISARRCLGSHKLP